MTVENRMGKYASALGEMSLEDLKEIINYLAARGVEDAQTALVASTPVAGGEQQMHHWVWRCLQCGGPVRQASWGPDLRCHDASHGLSVIMVSEETYSTPGKNQLAAWAIDKATGVNGDCAAHMTRWSPAPVAEDLAGRAFLLTAMASFSADGDQALVDFIKLTALSLLRGHRTRVDFPAKWREVYD